jgi:hypothetical protein
MRFRKKVAVRVEVVAAAEAAASEAGAEVAEAE